MIIQNLAFSIAAVLMVTVLPANAECGAAAEPEQADVTRQILVRFEDSQTEAEAARIIARAGAREIERLLDGKIYLIEIPYSASLTDTVAALSATKGVVYAEPNQQVSIPAPPDESKPDEGDPELIPLPGID